MAEKLYNAYHQEIELTDEQKECLNYKGTSTLVIKGLAGAGKSVVLMSLAQKLMDKYGNEGRNRIVIFTFQNPLVSNIKELLNANESEEDRIKVTTVVSYLKSIYDSLVPAGKAPKRKYPFSGRTGDEKRLSNVKKALEKHKSRYGEHRFHKLDPQFWIDEFDWMKEMNIWINELDDYLTIKRRGRGGKVRMSSADRITAYQIYSLYCEELEKTGQGDWADQALYLIRHADLIPEEFKFDHVLIDEAQDLSLAQMKALILLSKKDVVIAMDMNQRIFNKRWLPSEIVPRSVTKKLTQSMRTTKQIDALAESVRKVNDLLMTQEEKEEKTIRAIPVREGSLPQLVHLDDANSERKYVVSIIKKFLEANDKITIGILVSRKKQLPILADWLTSENIEHEHIATDSTFSVAKPGVKLVTAYAAKGLEFDIVMIPMFAEGNYPYGFTPDDDDEYAQFMIKMRNLVYVSMTRARFQLVITFWGNGGSRFIADMDESLYKLVGPKPVIRVPRRDLRVPQSLEDDEELQATGETPELVDDQKPVDPVVEQRVEELRQALNKSETKTTRKSATTKVATRNSAPKTPNASNLVTYLESKGIEYVDKRPKGGALWIIGDKSLDPIIQESKKKFGTMWIYKEEGGMVTKNKPGWYTKSTK